MLTVQALWDSCQPLSNLPSVSLQCALDLLQDSCRKQRPGEVSLDQASHQLLSLLPTGAGRLVSCLWVLPWPYKPHSPKEYPSPP